MLPFNVNMCCVHQIGESDAMAGIPKWLEKCTTAGCENVTVVHKVSQLIISVGLQEFQLWVGAKRTHLVVF